MTQIPQTHLMPVFARADLAFERGEGVWLIGTDGQRYLDFTSTLGYELTTRKEGDDSQQWRAGVGLKVKR